MLREELTPRELQLLELLATGMPTPRIADLAGLSYPYVRTAFQRMYQKTGAADKLELAVRYAWEELAPKH